MARIASSNLRLRVCATERGSSEANPRRREKSGYSNTPQDTHRHEPGPVGPFSTTAQPSLAGFRSSPSTRPEMPHAEGTAGSAHVKAISVPSIDTVKGTSRRASHRACN